MSELLKQARITPEGIQAMRDKIGISLRPRTRWNRSSAYDSVNHWCIGIGDDNPLWIDEDYGARTALGMNQAPPSFLYSIAMTVVQMGLQGVHGFHAGTDWRFFRPIPHDQRILMHVWLDEIHEQPSKLAGKSLATYFSTVFFTPDEDVLAHARSVTFRVERGATRERGKEEKLLEVKTWNDEELRAIEDAYSAEKPRGSEPRFWEDVQEGEALPQIIKGPLCMSDMIAFYAGAMVAPTPAHGLAIKDYKRHPNWWFRNPENGGLEPIIRVHENIAAARAAGVPAPYDVGVQRQSWLMHLVTNWMGDDAFMVRNKGNFRAFNYFGDLTTFTGEMVRKYVEDDNHLVELDIRGTNQRGVVSIPGSAVVALPSRNGGEKPVVKFHRERTKLRDFLATLPVAPKI